MHELSLAQSVLDIAQEAARSCGAQRINAIRLEIGTLSHVAPEALRFCFDMVTRESLAQEARLDIVATPGEAWCMPCAETVPLSALGEPCPRCGSYQLSVSRGDAMRVLDIEVS